MYDYGDSWESKFLLLTGEFGLPLLGCGLVAFVGGVIVTVASIALWNHLT